MSEATFPKRAMLFYMSELFGGHDTGNNPTPNGAASCV